MSNDQPMKRCSRGEQCVHPEGCLLPATPEYFNRDKTRPDGLFSYCKSCSRAHGGDMRTRHSDKIREGKRSYEKRNRERVRERQREYHRRNHDKILAQKRQYESQSHRRAARREYHQSHIEQHRRLGRAWNAANPEKSREIKRSATIRYRARKRALPGTLTTADWQRALDYFNGCCAVCNRPAGLWHTLAMDHWIPLTSPDCPGTTADNIVPLCHSKKGGERGCNNIKFKRLPSDWLAEQFRQRKASEILARIEAYFEWVRSQQSISPESSEAG